MKVLLLFTALNILNYLDRYVCAAVLPNMMQDLGLSNTQGGWIIAAFVPGYVIFSPIFGYLGDRVSRPKLMAFGALLWSVASIGSGLAPSFWMLIVFRVMIGIGEASFGTMAPGYIKDLNRDPVRVNSALSLFFAAIPVGSALGYVVGGLAAEKFTWQLAFLVAGIPGIFLGPLLLFFKEFSDRPAPPASVIAGVKEVYNTHILRYVIGGYICNSIALTGVAAFVTKYGQELGFSVGDIGFYFGVILLAAGFLGTFLGGRLASRLASKSASPVSVMLRFVGISAIVAAPLLVLGFTTDDKYHFLMLCAAAELLIFAGMAPINSILVLSCPQALVTLTQGITILLLNLLGSLPSPVVVGAVADAYSLRFGLQLLGIFLLASGIIWLLGTKVGRNPSTSSAG